MVKAFLIGAQKAGTTSLAHLLAQHPDIGFCSQKEPDYFSKSNDWKKNIANYHLLYPQDEKLMWMEGSTTYSWQLEYPEVPKFLKEYNSEAKLIYIVREPVARLKSHYVHNYLKAYTRDSLADAVAQDKTFIDHSSYKTQIEAYLKFFPKEQIKIIFFDDLKNKPKLLLEEVLSFLGLATNEISNFDFNPQNVSTDQKQISPLKNKLAPLFRWISPNFRALVKNALFTQKANYSKEVSPKLLEELHTVFEKDNQFLRQFCHLDKLPWE